ncbi:hypothetical protein [Kingella potus]|uniref:hypothetical protein n=1 Tax=Kingella potus TaxID=265175 RepID=UPI0011C01FF9|nr:hypothetical protein [Kingella potus]UOP00021.1 hypothetical protein LVJ84_08370 [Kingella potus]
MAARQGARASPRRHTLPQRRGRLKTGFRAARQKTRASLGRHTLPQRRGRLKAGVSGGKAGSACVAWAAHPTLAQRPSENGVSWLQGRERVRRSGDTPYLSAEAV